MNKTAVDWLRQELEYFREFEEFYTRRYQDLDQIFNRAKEIEKDEIMTALNFGYSDGRDNVKTWNSSEGYYNWRYNVTNK